MSITGTRNILWDLVSSMIHVAPGEAALRVPGPQIPAASDVNLDGAGDGLVEDVVDNFREARVIGDVEGGGGLGLETLFAVPRLEIGLA